MGRIGVAALFVGFLALLGSCTSQACNPCQVPCPDPCRCLPEDLPCTCWPEYGAPTAGQLLDEIVGEANLQLACPDLPPPVAQAWNELIQAAQWSRSHGSSCRTWTCQQHWQRVSACRDAVVALHGLCGAMPPPICFELNHDDPVPYMNRVPARPLR
jgi:hypothetical protein